ncbi:MAG: hypothetical protein JST30_10515 [Armatimonadetes bacterium]|nr:hypothetical protein [Armatimonadota bacterium]
MDDQSLSGLLREASLDTEAGDAFVGQTLRRVKLDRGARSLRFWLPAIVGAAVAGLAALSAVEMLYFMPEQRPVDVRGQEAKTAPNDPSLQDFIDPGTRATAR